MLWDTIPVPKGTDADFAVAVTDDSLAPWIKKGGTAYLRRRTELYDGDVPGFLKPGRRDRLPGSSAPTAAARCISSP